MKNNSKFKSAPTFKSFWSIPAQQQLENLAATAQGLSTEEAKRRISQYGANRLDTHKQTGNLRLFLAQFKSSIILILLFATILSFFLNDKADSAIIRCDLHYNRRTG